MAVITIPPIVKINMTENELVLYSFSVPRLLDDWTRQEACVFWHRMYSSSVTAYWETRYYQLDSRQPQPA